MQPQKDAFMGCRNCHDLQVNAGEQVVGYWDSFQRWKYYHITALLINIAYAKFNADIWNILGNVYTHLLPKCIVSEHNKKWKIL